MSTFVDAAFAIVVLVGALAAIFVGSAPWRARALAVLTLLALAAIVRVPPMAWVVTVPAQVAVVTTGAVAADGVASVLAARAAADPTHPEVHVVSAGADLRLALAQQFLRSGPRADERLLVWNAPLVGPTDRLPATVGAKFSTRRSLLLEPTALQARVLQAPSLGRPVELAITCTGIGVPLAVEVELRRGNDRVLSQRCEIAPGGSAVVAWVPKDAGTHELIVQTVQGDHRIERRGSLEVAPIAPILVLDRSGVIAAALRAQQVPLVERSELPAELEGFAAVALGIGMPPAAQEALAAAVDQGLGLFCTGAGLQRDGEPLRQILPVQLLPVAAGEGGEGDGPTPAESKPVPQPPAAPKPAQPEPPVGPIEDAKPTETGPAEVDKRAIAMVLLVDRSGSMGNVVANGATKMSYAKTSALRTALALDQGDQVGIVTFGNKDAGRVALSMTAATDRDAIQNGVQKLAHANEYTYLLGGLRQADRMLGEVSAAVKHVVVISDGEFDRNEEPALRNLAGRMARERGITLSIVSIIDANTAPEFRTMAEVLTREGGGVFLPVEDPRVVPQFVSAEVSRALDRVGRKPNGEGPGPAEPSTPPKPKPPEPKPPEPKPPEPKPPEPDQPQPLAVRAVFASPLLLPEPMPMWPTLDAMMHGAARPDALVLLVGGDAGMPVLAYGNRGLGRIAALTVDLASPASARLRAEPPFPARLVQWIEALRPPLPSLPQDLLRSAQVTPDAPLPSEVQALSALAPGGLAPLDSLRLPPPRTDVVHKTQVPAWALSALVLLVLLAVVEWWLARRVTA